MKKLTALLLAFILMISASACASGGSSGQSGQPSGQDQPSEAAEATGLSGEIGGEITVSCYDTMSYKAYLEEAAKLFEKKYPGTKVNVETFSAMPEIKTAEQSGGKMMSVEIKDDPQGRTDYINKVSSALMSGGGADILAMDVLPASKYAEGGQLENLDTYMDSDDEFDRSDYRTNVLDAVKYLDGTWFVPMDYTFDYYAYDSTLISGDAAGRFGSGGAFTAEQLIAIAKPVFDSTTKMFNIRDYMKGPDAGMFSRLLAESYASFVDTQNKRANFEEGGFAELLNAVKEYAELGYVPEGVTGQADAGAMMGRAGEAPSDRYYYKLKNNFSLIQQFSRNSGRRMMVRNAGSLDGIEDDDEIAGISAGKNGEVPFKFQQGYGINANSQNKRTAWEFIKFLMSEDAQLSTSLSPSSLPIHNTAREKKAEMVLSGAFMGRGEPMDDAQKEVLRQYLEAEDALAPEINSYTMRDTIIDDMILSEAAYFFEGTKTAEEVAGTLQSKVELYLNE